MSSFINSFVFITLSIVFQNVNNIYGEPLRLLCCEDGICLENDDMNSTLTIFPKNLFKLNDTGQLKVKIGLERGKLNCSIQDDIAIDISIAENGSSEKLKFDEDGYLYLDMGSSKFSPEEYCISSFSPEEIQIKICQTPEPEVEDKCGNRSQCIRKCCEAGEIYDLTNYGVDRIQCVPTAHSWSPTFYKNPYEKLGDDEQVVALRDAFIVSSHPREDWCLDDPFLYSQRKIRNEKRTVIRVLENGTVLVKYHYRKWKTLNPGSFCIDGAQNFPGNNNNESYYGDELDTIIIDCSSAVEETHTSNPIIYGVLKAIASCFLLLTIIVYAVLWERQNIHSWTVLGFVASMFILYASLVAAYLHAGLVVEDVSESSINGMFCSAIAVIAHFFFLSTFCWMTLINFDVWYTFKDLKLTVGNNKRRRRFMVYVLMAFGPPLVIVSVGLILDHIYAGDMESEIIRPEYGGSKCFMDVEFAIGRYIYLPVGVLLGTNLLFFGSTVYTLHLINESTKFATNMSSQSQPSMAKFFLFLKLFIVTGVTWTLDIVTWFVFGPSSTNILVYIVDILNILQPVAIFIIFVCKKEILRALKEKFPFVRRVLNAVRWKQTSRRSASSELTNDTNISTSSIRSLTGNQHHISLNTIKTNF